MADDGGNLKRRSLLRRAAITSAALGVGVPTLTGVAAAHQCPRTPGFWANHDWPGDGDDPTVDGEQTGLEQVNEALPGLTFATEAEGQAFLTQAKKGDKGQIMASHFVATILNYQFQGIVGGEDPCVTTGVADVDGDSDLESINDIIEYAQQWLEASAFPDSQDVWQVSGAPVEDGEVLKNLLDAFNNGNQLGLPGCNC